MQYLRSRNWWRSASGGKRGYGSVQHLIFLLQTFDCLQVDETVVLQRLARAHHLFDARRKRANPTASCGQNACIVNTSF